MQRIGFILFFFVFIFSYAEADAKTRCGQWLRRQAHWASSPIHPILFKSETLKEIGERNFFKKKGRAYYADLIGLEKYLLAQIPSKLTPEFQSNLLLTLHHFKRGQESLLPFLDFKRADEFYKKRQPNLLDVLGYLKSHEAEVKPLLQTYLDQIPREQLRSPFRFFVKYRWIIAGTTVLALWTPFQAEIASGVYAVFNWSRSAFGPATPPAERIEEIDRIRMQVKDELREMYFISTEDYPSTMMMSRNNLSYVHDLVNKRRDELAAARERDDETGIEQKLMQLYLVPFVYHDILREPLGGFVVEVLVESFDNFDPDGRYWEIFKTKLQSFLTGEAPELWMGRLEGGLETP